jgi:nicotinamide phosphoribosyltransferase
MSFLSPVLLCDFYKLSHRAMYPEGTETVYSTWTPRASRLPGVDKVVCFGAQMALAKITTMFNNEFFRKPKSRVVSEYVRVVRHTLGVADPETKHIEDLHDLGYLPISVKSLPEGMLVPVRVPMMTVQNTDPRFFWLTNYLETFFSCELWKPSTSATLAHAYRKVLTKFADETVGNLDFVPFQGHDFSMRGMSSLDCAIESGMGHLLSFVGTDTIPAIQGAEHYYGARVDEETIGTSIPATEHSVQCAYGDDDRYFEEMITRVHPHGFVSIVADGYDFWEVMGRVLPALKDKIMARHGKVVIRPDSGDPVSIVCGDPFAKESALSRKGAVEVLWDTFGGTVNAKGYKELDPHVGLIYGDAITLDRAKAILVGLAAKGFASTNIVFGVGSYTYQMNTRDTFGFAMKSTLAVINGEEHQIFKTPKTDDGTKHSQRGRVMVVKDKHGVVGVVDRLSLAYNGEDHGDMLVEVYRDGEFLVTHTFAEIRERLASQG